MCLVNDTLQITNSAQMPFFYSHSFYRMIVFKNLYIGMHLSDTSHPLSLFTSLCHRRLPLIGYKQ